MRLSFIGLTLVVTLLAGCVSLVTPPTTPMTTYVLSVPPHPPVDRPNDTQTSLLYVPRVTAPAYLDGTRLIFSRDELTRNSYQFATWAEPLPARLTTLIVEAIGATGHFKAVTRQTGAVSSDFALHVDILDFRHSAEQLPGDAIVALRGTVTDLKRGALVRTITTTKIVPVTEGTARGAVVALGEATGQSLAELAAAVIDATGGGR